MKLLLDTSYESEFACDLRNSDCISPMVKFLVNRDITFPLNNIRSYWESLIEEWISSLPEETQEEEAICFGVSLLIAFIQEGWTGPKLDKEAQAVVDQLKPENFDSDVKPWLLADNDSLSLFENLHLLFCSISTFEVCCRLFSKSFWCNIWLARGLFIQQQVLDDVSPTLYDRITKIFEEISDNLPICFDEASFHLECARIHIYYGFIEKCEDELAKASTLAGLQFYFTGALGKRTKFQQTDIPQLIMKVDLSDESSKHSLDTVKPRHVELQDDVMLDEVKLIEPQKEDLTNLSACHVAILLGHLMLRKKSLPQDELSVEEHKAALERMLRGSGSWSVQLSTLLFRSYLERTSKRTVERAMMQVQAVLDDCHGDSPVIMDRLQDFFMSHLPSKREMELTLADLLISLGAIKSALDIALRLQDWETAAACYNALQLRHKAKELIEIELQKEETPKLWCLLGDATDDIKCYEKAWELSNNKSARAQRHWANYLYARKQYAESIEHFEASLAINSLQTQLWFRLGFAALHEEKWKLAASAYRRYCTLDNECFEAWNNMARCYCELKETKRAWRALQEALKIDHTNWRVWDNYLLVSAELRELHEVVRSYHEVLNLKNEKHLDLPVLRALVNGYNDLQDEKQRDLLRKKILELFGRLTSQIINEAELWVLYAEVLCLDESVASYEKQRDLLLKAHRSAVSKPGWEMNLSSCRRVLAILERLLSVTIAAKSQLRVTAIKMAANASVSIISRCHPNEDLSSDVTKKIEELGKLITE